MYPFNRESKLTAALQMASLVALISTLFGFLIVNMYLAFYDFWDFNFLKIQYFSAGGLFLFLVAIPGVFAYAFFRARDIVEKYREKDSSQLRSWTATILKLIVFGFVVALGVVFVAIMLSFGGTAINQSIIAFIAFVWPLLIFSIVAVSIKSREEIEKVGGRNITFFNMVTYFMAHFKMLYVLPASLILLLMFTFFVYPTVPRYVGGGKPATVNIGFAPGFDSSSLGLTNPAEALLVYQSAESLLLLTSEGVYQIGQENVAYVKYPGATARINKTHTDLASELATSTAPTTIDSVLDATSTTEAE